MELFIARQPIFDKHQIVFGYELLYRMNRVNSYLCQDEDKASSNVIVNTFQVMSIDRIANGKKAFINFTANLLNQGVATLFPNDSLVVEVLETVNPEHDIIESCKELKNRGYSLALDDFIFREEYRQLIDLADIIKVDFLNTDNSEKKHLPRHLGNGKIRFLAEKVESREDFENAKSWGYSYFQGYFFSRPVILFVNDIPQDKMNYLKLIQEVNREEIDFERISHIIERDVALSYKLLKLVNSAAYGFRTKMTSLRNALVVLGTTELRKWVSLLALRGIGEDKPDEILRLSVIRAKFCELIAIALSMRGKKDDLFLMGLFSTLDVLMNRPLEEILKGLSISSDIKDALLKMEGLPGWIYQLILSYERGAWDEAGRYALSLSLNKGAVADAYMKAVEWCNTIGSE